MEYVKVSLDSLKPAEYNPRKALGPQDKEYQEINRGTKLGQVLRRMDSANATSTYALVKGYNVIDGNSGGYYVILDRNAITMSSKTKAPTGSNW